MSSHGAATWVKFFTNAGIENKLAASYAHIFVENRIRTDMLSELNKEYLREMGITVMGDIISILRQAKIVNDQNVRDKILSIKGETKTVAKVRPASPVQTSQSRMVTISSSVTQPRRVLPEHEGKYKVSMPKGSTKKTRDIMKKHSALQMDKTEKQSIFDRLNATNDVEMEDEGSLTKLGKVSKSIFNRLGGYDEIERKVTSKSIEFSGILKNSSTKQSPTGVVKRKVPQKVILSKKAPIRPPVDTDSDMDEEEEKMDSDEYKQVKFSPEVEVLEIEPRQPRNIKLNSRMLNRLKNLRADGIKNRLNMDVKLKRTVDNNTKSLHTIRKTVNMKPTRSPQLKSSRMKADQSPISVKARLDINKTRKSNSKGNQKAGSSVFNRLGTK